MLNFDILFVSVLARHRLDPVMAERFISSHDLAAKLLAELDAETMSVPPAPKVNLNSDLIPTPSVFFCFANYLFIQDTESKRAKKPHVRSRKLKSDVEKAQAAAKAEAEMAAKAPSLVVSKVSDKVSSGVSSGSKRKAPSFPEDALIGSEEPLQKRTRVEKFGIDTPFTSISPAQKMARVRSALHTLYTDADDKALLDLGMGEINALYESWLEVTTCPDFFYFSFGFSLCFALSCRPPFV